MSKGKVVKRIIVAGALIGAVALVVRKLRQTEQAQALWEVAAGNAKDFANGAWAAASAVADNVRESAEAVTHHND